MTQKKRYFFVSTFLCLFTAFGGETMLHAATDLKPTIEQPSTLEQQTELLIKTLVDKGYVGGTSPEDAKKMGPSIEEDVYKEFALYKDLKTDRRKSAHPAKGVYKQGKLQDNEALYRVAVSDKLVTLDEAIQIGLANNLNSKAAAKKIDVARAKVAEARRALFPTAQISTEVNAGKAQGNATNLGGRLYRGKNWKVNVTQPVFYGGELVYTVKQAESSWKSAIEEFKKAKTEFIQQVQVAYFGALKNQYNFEYQNTLYKDIDVYYRRVRTEHQKKLISDIDFLNAESQYYQVFFQFENARSELLSAQLALNQALGLDVAEPLPIDMHLEFVPVKPDLYEVLELAMRQNPDVRIKQYSLESAELGIKIFKAKKLPKVDLRGSYGMLGEVFKDTQEIENDNADLDTEKEWFFGAGVSMPLGLNTLEYQQIKHHYGPTILALTGSEDWNHKVSLGILDKLSDATDSLDAEATLLQAQADLDKAKNETILHVREEFYNMQKSLIQIDSTLAKMRYQNKQVAAYRFLVGLQETAVSALMEGMIEQAQNKFGFIQAVADYHTAVAGLNAAIGDPDHFKSRA
jgi:outer membrane protein TolC